MRCEAAGEEADLGDVDPVDGPSDARLEVLREPAASSEPRERTFDHPPARQDVEADRGMGALHDLDRPAAEVGDSVAEFVTGVAAGGEQGPQPWVETADRRDDPRSAVTVLDVGAMHLKTDEVTFCVGDNVALAALDLLAGVKATRSTAFGGFHRSRCRSRRARLAARLLARHHDQRMIDPDPGTVMRPSIEILLHGRIGRKLIRQLPPLAAGRRHVEDRVQHRPQVGLQRPPDPVRQRHQRRDSQPLRVRHVACVAQALAAMLRPRDLGPRHRDLHLLCSNNHETTAF